MPVSNSSASLPPISRIAVVGGGALGVRQTGLLLEEGVPIEKIVCYESKGRLGGLWLYEGDDPGPCIVDFTPDGYAVARTATEKADPKIVPPNALYRDLRTNLPNQVMAFRGHPFPDDTDLFPRHEKILEYIEKYADDAGVLPSVRFDTLVTRIHQTPDFISDAERWTIESRHNGEVSIERFSHVVLASGHYSEAHIPYTEGLWNFNGSLGVTHSRWWRTPQGYEGKKVLVIGSKASGGDICRDLALANLSLSPSDQPSQRTTILQSVRRSLSEIYPPPQEAWQAEIELRPSISHITVDPSPSSFSSSSSEPTLPTPPGTPPHPPPTSKIHFKDGSSTSNVDAIIFATGYNFNFPFLHPTDAPWRSYPLTRDRRKRDAERAKEDRVSAVPKEKIDEAVPEGGGSEVDQLDGSLQMFYEPDPTLAIVGLTYLVVPFRIGEALGRVLARTYQTTRSVPRHLPPFAQSIDVPTNRHYTGFPGEVINQENWLQGIGEQDPDWTTVDEDWKLLRTNAPALRRKELGY